ncbi:uncharacterized protein LOC143294673 [Babylonia areolata]|uniref:uncharacterized protein LOC143294673 n=1 Tax=Babylonia areolata TaxID=304850 RepID=UPI003FD519E7
MLDLMTWSEIVDNLRSEGNLKMAAIFDLDGERLGATQGVAISKSEVQGVLKSLQIPCSTIYALFLGGAKVNCLRVDERTLLGRTPEDVFVAYRNNDVLICASTALGNKSSCLGSVRNFALKLNMQPVPDAVASPSLI